MAQFLHVSPCFSRSTRRRCWPNDLGSWAQHWKRLSAWMMVLLRLGLSEVFGRPRQPQCMGNGWEMDGKWMERAHESATAIRPWLFNMQRRGLVQRQSCLYRMSQNGAISLEISISLHPSTALWSILVCSSGWNRPAFMDVANLCQIHEFWWMAELLPQTCQCSRDREGQMSDGMDGSEEHFKAQAAFDALLEIQEDVSQLHFSQTAVLVAVPGWQCASDDYNWLVGVFSHRVLCIFLEGTSPQTEGWWSPFTKSFGYESNLRTPKLGCD